MAFGGADSTRLIESAEGSFTHYKNSAVSDTGKTHKSSVIGANSLPTRHGCFFRVRRCLGRIMTVSR